MKKWGLVLLLCMLGSVVLGCQTETDIFYTVLFDTHTEEVIEDASVKANETIVLPILEREGYLFTGWFAGDSVNDLQFGNHTPITQDLTLYARWVQEFYTIYFETNISEELSPLNVARGSQIVLPASPTLADHVFLGWYLNEALSVPFVPGNMPEYNFTLHAKWNEQGAYNPETLNQDLDIEFHGLLEGKTFYLTTIGQNADYEVVYNILVSLVGIDEAKIVRTNLLIAADLNEGDIVIIVPGASTKGMGDAGTDQAAELARANALQHVL